jgi:hypothetical protein
LVHRPGEDISLLMDIHGFGWQHYFGVNRIVRCDWVKEKMGWTLWLALPPSGFSTLPPDAFLSLDHSGQETRLQ